MSHVLSREKREQVIALGRLGWSLRRIEQATGVRRETAGDYLRDAGIALRRPGGWGRHSPSKPAIDPITDSGAGDSKPAIEVITGFLAKKPGCGPASSCEPYRELIALELERGRNAMGIWQDLVDSHGFADGVQVDAGKQSGLGRFLLARGCVPSRFGIPVNGHLQQVLLSSWSP